MIINTDINSIELLPPDKREDRLIALSQALSHDLNYASWGGILQAWVDEVKKRANYYGGKLVTEFVLNDYIYNSFNQYPLTNPIYITLPTAGDISFLIGTRDETSSYFNTIESNGWIKTDNPTFPLNPYATINIPLALTSRIDEITNILENFLPLGTQYTIKTY